MNDRELEEQTELREKRDAAYLRRGRLVSAMWHGWRLERKDDLWACYTVHNPDEPAWWSTPERAMEAAGLGEDVEDLQKARGER